MNKVLVAIAAILGLGGVFLYTANKQNKPESASQFEVVCHDPQVKGNISATTGEKIYHLPGDKFYSATVIDEGAGEKWFCTEDEAVDAGWRHSER
jgi:hypothetical protein